MDFWVGVVIDLLGITATVIIAVMTFRIAKRQTEIAEESKRLADIATEATQRQADLSERLTSLEESRERSTLVPSNLSWSEPDDFGDVELCMYISNFGGPAWSVLLSAIQFSYAGEDGQAQKVSIALEGSDILETCNGEHLYRTRIGGPLMRAKPDTSVVISALTGIYRDKSGVRELSYQLKPGACAALRRSESVQRLEDLYRRVISG